MLLSYPVLSNEKRIVAIARNTDCYLKVPNIGGVLTPTGAGESKKKGLLSVINSFVTHLVISEETFLASMHPRPQNHKSPTPAMQICPPKHHECIAKSSLNSHAC